jgi:hypothetical protein
MILPPKEEIVLDPIVLSSITASVSVLASEFVKGVASEAGKGTWTKIKCLMGWSTEPDMAEMPRKIAEATSASPELVEKLLELLKNSQTGASGALVYHLSVSEGGKVVVAQNVTTLNM